MFLDIFKEKYYDELNSSLQKNILPNRDRGDSLLKIFSVLESEFSSPYNIVETGTTRSIDSMIANNPDLANQPKEHIDRERLRDEGSSTLIFDEFVNYHDGSVISIDINKDSCEYANGITSDKTQVIESDSIKYLWENEFPNTCLFYLDSYDVDFIHPVLSNFHHMKELTCISKYLTNCLVVVDDCKFSKEDCEIAGSPDINPDIVGKGLMIKEFMDNIKAELVYDGYQQVWRLP
jgi:hypothetical protein